MAGLMVCIASITSLQGAVRV